MISIVLTNRDRDLNIVKKCLDSLKNQSNLNFELFFVDYGSNENYLIGLEEIIEIYPKINFICCPVSGQLWNKCRAINIALKKCNTPYFFVGDIDMIYHPDFVNKLYELKNTNGVTYFRVGFLNKNESLATKDFQDFKPDFLSEKDATGMTLFPTELLKEISGYDEFYHGWGAEDTDVHNRIENAGISISFYDEEILIKHQWHSKTYRNKLSRNPFHSQLERLNHTYMLQTKKMQKTVVNQNQEWGKLPSLRDYEKLMNPNYKVELKATVFEVNAILGQMTNFSNQTIAIEIIRVPGWEKAKNLLKKILGKKYQSIYNMNVLNDVLLETIINHYRNNSYSYSFSSNKKCIKLNITL